MPNWCSNHITVRGTDSAQIKRLADAFDAGEFCNAVVPVPASLQIVAGRVSDPAEQKKLEEDTAYNLREYGYGNWYDFCVARWGTKWDVSCDGGIDVSDDGLTINASFESAWAPPCHVYEAMVEDEYSVTAYYYEPGMGFVGKWEDGIDDCYEYGGETSKTVRDAIGDELDDYFGISESMAEYEDENEIDELEEFLEQGAEVKGLNKPEPLKFD